MQMDLSAYRASEAERQRTASLVALMPASGRVALDIGARDGYLSRLLAERFDRVIALDLAMPAIDHERIECVTANAASMPLRSGSVDFVMCAEVLEHVPARQLATVCREIDRVCTGGVLIGVPYRQDIRIGRTTCYSCMGKNPPWGHVNAFDEARVRALFAGYTVAEVAFVGVNRERTNALSCALMDLAGNPYGTYSQDEPCIHCGKRLVAPPPRRLAGKILTRLAYWSRHATEVFASPHGNWMHILLSRKPVSPN